MGVSTSQIRNSAAKKGCNNNVPESSAWLSNVNQKKGLQKNLILLQFLFFAADMFPSIKFDFPPGRSQPAGTATFRDISAGRPQFTKGAGSYGS